jgi:hypothetical protein
MAALGVTGHAFNANGDGIIVAGLAGDLLEGLTGSQTLDASTGFDAFIRLISPTRLFTTAFKDIQGLSPAIMPPASHAAEGAAKAAEGAAKSAEHAISGAVGGVPRERWEMHCRLGDYGFRRPGPVLLP